MIILDLGVPGSISMSTRRMLFCFFQPELFDMHGPGSISTMSTMMLGAFFVVVVVVFYQDSS